MPATSKTKISKSGLVTGPSRVVLLCFQLNSFKEEAALEWVTVALDSDVENEILGCFRETVFRLQT